MERAVGRPGEDMTVENPGVEITSEIEIYWFGEERWTPICLDTRVVSITYDPGGESGSAVVWWLLVSMLRLRPCPDRSSSS